MTKVIVATVCLLLFWLWSWFQILCNFNFWHCFNLFPYVVFFMILDHLDSKRKRRQDVAVQADIEIVKDVSTQTNDLFDEMKVYERMLLLVKRFVNKLLTQFEH
ncbi:hypothetical protein HNY73_014720 [Argiope bruennichi]|uniref:Uncharacterized protein n=1 Tax=Argiope bruennichi TaxID=94029 RepID=A0A8T0EQ87_ARGBR|nr:hypothetical protein HNY73_014720 [Argiope bruennichi]